MRQWVWHQDRPASRTSEPGWLQDIATAIGVTVVVTFVMFTASLVLMVVGGDGLEAGVWRVFAILSLLNWAFRRVGWDV